MANEKKDKLKDKILIWSVTLIIAIITIVTAILYNKDIANMSISNDNVYISLYDKAITMDNGGATSRITNENTSYIFGNEFSEGYSYFKLFNADTDWLNEFVSRDTDFYGDDFHPYIKFNFLYNFSYDSTQYFGDLKYSYWLSPSYMYNGALVTNYINNNVPTSYYSYIITDSDYRNGDDVSFLVSIYYDLMPYYSKTTSKLQENFLPCVIIPTYIYSDINEITLNLMQVSDYVNTDHCIKYIDYYPTTPLELTSNYNDLIIQNQTLLNQNEDLQWQLDMKNIDLVEAVQRQQTEYDRGYQNGLNDAVNTDISNNGFKVLFNSILSFPINFISQSLNFEFMGINVASIVLFLCSVGIVLFVIKRLWK